MKLQEILEGKKAGKMQKVGIMQIIPLFYQSEDLINWGIATPGQSLKMGTSHYGSMDFENTDAEKLTIIPSHYGVITKQAAQDHAMAKTGLVPPQSTVRYDDAFCIEQTQGGHIQSGQYDFLVLPYTLRTKALAKKGIQDYSRLWSDITAFNQETGINRGSGGHLTYFFDKYKDELGEFIAQFENLPNQIGAVILIDGRVVGVEVAPNPDYWADVWQPLIRSCYGSETVRRLIKEKDKLSTKNKISDSAITQAPSLDELEEAVIKFEANEKSKAESIISAIMEQNLKTKVDHGGVRANNKKYDVLDVHNSSYAGQIVKEDDFVVYASIVANDGRALKKNAFAF